MKRFLLAFLAALLVVGAVVAIGMSLRPGDQSTDFQDWIDDLDGDDGSNENSGIFLGSADLVEVDLEDSIEWDKEGTISIDSDVSDIEILLSESDQISVHTKGKVTENIEVYLEVEKKQDRIVIRIRQERPESLINNTTNLDTTIALPKDFAGDLDIQTNVGDVQFGTFQGKRLTIDSDVGDVIGLAEADFIDLDSNVGKIDVVVSGGEITLNSDVGEIEFTCDKADGITATSDVGAIHATLADEMVQKGIAADAGIGDVDSNVSFVEGRDRDAAIHLYTDVGEIKIRKQ